MKIKVEKLTDVDLLRKANSFTTGRDSKMSLRKAYASMHSPIRTQLFFIEMEDIPLFCASQFVRSKVGVEWWQRSKRTDRGGEDFRQVCQELGEECSQFRGKIQEGFDECESKDMQFKLDCLERHIRILPQNFDRYAPTSLAGLFNAESIINMSHKRLCMKASKETREIWDKVLEDVLKVDPDLYLFCVPPCVYKGYCSEPKPCGYTKSDVYKEDRETYLKLFENE